jgi:hypothetical protein
VKHGTKPTVRQAKILQAKDHLIRDMLIQGCAITYPTENKPAKGHDEPESVQNRINYLANRLKRQTMPAAQIRMQMGLSIEQFMWLNKIAWQDCTED